MLNNDCGQSCAHFILNLNSINLSIYSVKELMPIDNNGINFKQISELLNKYRLITNGYYLNKKAISDLKIPSIAQVRLYDNMHFIVILKKHLFTYTIYDPNYGVKKISRLKFNYISTGYVLTINNSKQYLHKPIIKIESIKLKQIIGLLILTTILTYSDTLYFKYLIEYYHSSAVYLYTIIYIGINIGKYFLISLTNYFMLRLIIKYSNRLHQLTIDKINNLLPIKENYKSDLQNRLHGINSYQYYLLNVLNYWVGNTMIIVVGIVIAFIINRYLALFLVGLIVIIIGIILIFKNILNHINYNLNQLWIMYNDSLLNLNSLAIQHNYQKYLHQLLKYSDWSNLESTIRMIIFIIGYGGLIITNLYLINIGHLEIATFIQFNTIVINVIGPINQLITNLDIIRDYKIAQGRINQLLA